MSETKTTEKSNNQDLSLLEMDDEFEEFPANEWDKNQEDPEDVQVWEDNWDDCNTEDDFSVQLKKFSRKRPLSASRSPPLRSPEPQAKKVCSRPSPASQDEPEPMQTNGNRPENGNSDQGDGGGGRRSTRRSTRSSSRSSSAATPSESPRTPTRSSARLRSSRK